MSEATPTPPQPIPHTENLENESRVFDFLEMSGDQYKKFKKEVEEHDGLVRVFIHPISAPKGDYQEENYPKVLDVLGRNIKSKVSPPVIIFEETFNMGLWKEKLEQRMPLPNDLYVIPTMRDYPYPIIPGKPAPTRRDAEGKCLTEDFPYVEEGMTMFINTCKNAGVKKILIGGTNLEIINDQLNRCVGNFINILKNYSEFELKVSMGTAPLNRNDLRDSNPELV